MVYFIQLNFKVDLDMPAIIFCICRDHRLGRNKKIDLSKKLSKFWEACLGSHLARSPYSIYTCKYGFFKFKI